MKKWTKDDHSFAMLLLKTLTTDSKVRFQIDGYSGGELVAFGMSVSWLKKLAAEIQLGLKDQEESEKIAKQLEATNAIQKEKVQKKKTKKKVVKK